MQKTIFLTLIFILIHLTVSASDIDELRVVLDRVDAWQDAWQKKTFDQYISFYSPEFKSDRIGKNIWSRRKKRIFQDAGPISVDISKLCIGIDNDHSLVTFFQHYQSPAVSDTGKKTLIWKKGNGIWKIVSELWEPLSPLPDKIRKSSAE